MGIVRFATECDTCHERGPEYGAMSLCADCGRGLCPDHAAAWDDEYAHYLCHGCAWARIGVTVMSAYHNAHVACWICGARAIDGRGICNSCLYASPEEAPLLAGKPNPARPTADQAAQIEARYVANEFDRSNAAYETEEARQWAREEEEAAS